MKFKSCDAKWCPDKEGKPNLLKEGEYYFSKEEINGHTCKVIWCCLPEIGGPSTCRLPLNVDKAAIGALVSWTWDGDIESPTLTPSILTWLDKPDNYVWHGYLKAGRFEARE